MVCASSTLLAVLLVFPVRSNAWLLVSHTRMFAYARMPAYKRHVCSHAFTNGNASLRFGGSGSPSGTGQPMQCCQARRCAPGIHWPSMTWSRSRVARRTRAALWMPLRSSSTVRGPPASTPAPLGVRERVPPKPLMLQE
jgi:hypothetical protein